MLNSNTNFQFVDSYHCRHLVIRLILRKQDCLRYCRKKIVNLISKNWVKGY